MRNRIVYVSLVILISIGAGLSANAQVSETPDNGGRAYFDFGVFDYEDGNYAEAAKNFKIALQFNPDNPYYNHYLGKTWLRMEQYDEARTYLEKARNINPEMTNLKYDRAYLAYKAENYAEAAELFREVAREEPENVLAQYYAGISLYRQEQYSAAVDYFISAADKSPTIRANGYYYAGLSYYKSGRPGPAEDMFERVQQMPDAGTLGENAAQWLAALQKRREAVKPYSLYLKLGRRYDDNVQLEPDDLDLPSDESDWATLGYFSGKYNALIRDTFLLGAGYSHYQIWYDDLDDFDLTGSIFHLYGSYHFTPFTFRMNYFPAYFWNDGDSYLRQHRLEPEMLWQISDRLLTRLTYRYHDNTYFEESDRSGHSNELFLDGSYQILSDRGRLYAGLGYEDYSASAADQDFERWRLALAVYLEMPWELEFGLAGQYQDRDYDNVDELYGVSRSDERYIVSASLSRTLFYEWLGILGEYKYIRNDSNINDFEYTRNMATLSVTVTY